jgi:SAM-dependent methyltransferase
VQEWASSLTAAGYLTHEPTSGRFSLPEAHRATLAAEGGTLFQGGMLQNLLGVVPMLDTISAAFRSGDGIDPSSYPEDCFEGMARMTGAAHQNVLVPKWIPTMPDVEARLREGCAVADVGCGQGRAVVAMAKAFPASSFVGYDALAVQREAAQHRAEDAGVADRVRLLEADAVAGLPESHDLIWLFDVVHDTGDPVQLLRSMRAALNPGGVALVLEPNAGDTLADNIGPLSAHQYGTSVLYCLPVALAAGDAGLGTCGSTEPTIRAIAAEAGFAAVDEAPIDNPFNRLWILRTTADT